MFNRENTISFLRLVSDKIQQAINSKGLNDTGGAAESLEIKLIENENKGQLLGADYIYFLDQGRGPGRFPPVDTIRDWVRRKLGISDERENKQVGYLVGRKISVEGTSIYKNKSEGIELDRIIEESLRDLKIDPDLEMIPTFKEAK